MTSLARLEALLDEWLEQDPDAASRFIESQLARIALRRRLACLKASRSALSSSATERGRAEERARLDDLISRQTGHSLETLEYLDNIRQRGA
jgi:hypothetical protein